MRARSPKTMLQIQKVYLYIISTVWEINTFAGWTRTFVKSATLLLPRPLAPPAPFCGAFVASSPRRRRRAGVSSSSSLACCL